MRATFLVLASALVLVAPTADAVEVCDGTVCAGTWNERLGDGSCDKGAPLAYEAHGAYVETDDAAIAVFSDCFAADWDGWSYRYRETAAVISTSHGDFSFYWWAQDTDGQHECHMVVEAVLIVDASCAAGEPLMFPALP